jgi:hypothetical protein
VRVLSLREGIEFVIEDNNNNQSLINFKKLYNIGYRPFKLSEIALML